MSEGKGKIFLEGWLKLLLDRNPTVEQQTFKAVSEDFGRVFHPFNTRERAWIDLGNLKQDKNDYKDDYKTYILEFQLLTAKSEIVNEKALIEWFIKGLDPHLSKSVLSCEHVPTTLSRWAENTAAFHAQHHRIDDPQAGKQYVPSFSTSKPSSSKWNSNAMDVDMVRLTPVQQVEHMKQNKCFI